MSKLRQELDSEQRSFGSGWISGFLSLALAILGFLTVLCFCFPEYLTIADARDAYANNLTAVRFALLVVLIAAFCLGVVSAALRKNKILGFTALALVLASSLMGGHHATARGSVDSPVYLGLDFFMLNLILLGAIFIPIERVFKKNDQDILRYEWREDVLYFLISTLFVQVLSYISLNPSLALLSATAGLNNVRCVLACQPYWLQFLEIMFLTDFVQYWFHRTFHKIPWLWKFHAVHHSAQAMDWLAGSRMHLFEVIMLRAFTTLPMYVLGFAEAPLYAYIFFVYLMSVFIHANLRLPQGWLQYVIATPRFHHWHHGLEEEAIDVNFAIHFPVIDMVFGTFHMPGDRWPDGYGVGGPPVPKGFFQQFLYTFQKDQPAETETHEQSS